MAISLLQADNATFYKADGQKSRCSFHLKKAYKPLSNATFTKEKRPVGTPSRQSQTTSRI